MVLRNRIKLGIEIEFCYNSDLVNFNLGSYHSGRKIGKNWKAERDGSLNRSRVFEEENTAEFVSKVLGSKKTYNNALTEFKSFFNGHPLNEIIDFNRSCGNHIHIGINNNKKYHDKLSFDIFKELRDLYFKKINDSIVLSDDTKQKITNHYFRGYAEKINKINWNKGRLSRGVEFNKQSENNGFGIEWRSINLRGVKDWAEFDECFKIIYDCAEWLFNKRTTPHKEKFKSIRLNRADLITKQNQNKAGFSIDIKSKNAGPQKINLNVKNSEVLQCVI